MKRLVVLGLILGFFRTAQPQNGADEIEKLKRDLATLSEELSKLSSAEKADAEVYAKGVAWALDYESKWAESDRVLLQKALLEGHARAAALAAGEMPWAARKGRLVRGYRSRVDGSVQPYGLIIPRAYDGKTPMRLDVVLHGSSRPTGMSELRFMSRFEDNEPDGKRFLENYIELHPLGRVENCYRWSGETDVFEAIEAVSRHYAIDPSKIVLRGMSMGASGTWHLGLKHPDRFAALGPYCGYVDTHHFSETPGMNFVKVGPLPEHQERMLHMLDSVDYAANAHDVPVVACIGEKDPFFQAHVLMGEAMKREGLNMVNLISPGTGHTIDPVTQKEQLGRIALFAGGGRLATPLRVEFVTWTLKYSRCDWIQALALGAHYERAELTAGLQSADSVLMKEPRNVTKFALYPPVLRHPGSILQIGDTEIPLPEKRGDGPLIIGRRGKTWEVLPGPEAAEGKRPGLQGPIDDAFTEPFLCVRGTGDAWNPAVGAWAEANLKRFAYEWRRYFRGTLPVKDDRDVTEDDLKRSNLILFGDPSSNSWIRKVLPQLPVGWTKEAVTLGTATYPARNHAPALISPNPLPGADGRYVVLNSGHTFHEKELALLNYLLFPRQGDWAVFKVGERKPATPSDPLDEEVLQSGFFDESWKLAGGK